MATMTLSIGILGGKVWNRRNLAAPSRIGE
jgi:hypothetical protein